MLLCEPAVIPAVRTTRNGMFRRENQISVPLDDELRQFIERRAALEQRTLAQQVRFYLAQAARQAGEMATAG